MDYRTGLIWQDTQHTTLIELFDRVGNMTGHDAGRELGETLQEIADFATGHFAVEEAYMAALDYPDREGHIRDHTHFLRRLGKLAADSPVADEELLTCLSQQTADWFLEHIMGSDRRLAAFIREAGAG